MAPENLELESAINDLMNMRSTLSYVSYWALSNYTRDRPLPNEERDAMIGAVDAMERAVGRVAEAHEVEHRARAKSPEP